MYQLALPLADMRRKQGPGLVRSIPEVAADLLELCPGSPSGLIWKVDARNGRKKKGDPAGTPVKGGKYYLVGIKGKMYYAHRIEYYLRTSCNPGSMIVRHTSEGSLILGSQSDNRKDDIGKARRAGNGYRTKRMFIYEGKLYNLRALCLRLQISYAKAYNSLVKKQMSCHDFFVHACGELIHEASAS